MSRLLITGGSGFLGSRLIQAAGDRETHATGLTRPVPGPALPHRVDLRDAGQVGGLIRRVQPAVIVHTACSNNSAEEIAAIVPAAQSVAAAAQAAGARLIHVSSDLVFDGEHAPYYDHSSPAPLGVYARAKAEAEAAVTHLAPSALIVRPSLIWSLAPIDKQTAWLVAGVKRGAPVTLFTDEVRCPVFVDDLCAALLELAARPDLSGPMNLVGPRAFSRWAWGQWLLRALSLEPGPNVRPGTMAASGLIRARNLTLIAARAARELTTPLRAPDAVVGTPVTGRGHA